MPDKEKMAQLRRLPEGCAAAVVDCLRPAYQRGARCESRERWLDMVAEPVRLR